jgi:hypothetical protein
VPEVVDDQHVILVAGPDPNVLAGIRGERVSATQRASAEFVAVEVARSDGQQRGAELVFARFGVLLDEADRLQGAQDSVDGPLG